jgi:hypothetical protein
VIQKLVKDLEWEKEFNDIKGSYVPVKKAESPIVEGAQKESDKA